MPDNEQAGEQPSAGGTAEKSLKNIQVGVFISPRALALVMTGIRQAKSPRDLVKWEYLPLPETLHPDSERFAQFLKKTLGRFTGRAKKAAIWCAIDPTGLKIKHITIPDVPKKKVAGAAFWGLKRETDFDDTREIFDFEILDDVVEDGVKKKKILVFSGAADHIKSLENMFIQAGYPLTGITALPFALHNFIRSGQVTPEAQFFAITHISQDNCEIYCYSKSGALLVRSLRTGALNLMEELDDNRAAPQLSLDGEEKQETPSLSAQIQEMSERLVSKIIRTGDYCAQHYTGNTPIDHYYFLGETDEFAPFMSMARDMIPGGVRFLAPEPKTDAGIARPELPGTAAARSAVLMAFGMSLSADDITPNFLCTTRDKIRTRYSRSITRAVFLAGCVVLLAGVGVNMIVSAVHKKDLAALARLDQESARIGSDVSAADIQSIIRGSEKSISRAGDYVDRYRPLAVIFDLCRITPPQIRLTSLAYGVKEGSQGPARTINIQGKITGPGTVLEAELAHYMLTLSTSPVFGNIQVTKQHTEVGQSKEQLLFTATLEVF
ncbi:MAG: hypothetical protein K9K40_10300 [Desulfotignum sp.]|nr:hypothetical protein [Desulfotignum sp.]MCF8126026.1 hypothetical protein [Desulfotignum sp.]